MGPKLVEMPRPSTWNYYPLFVVGSAIACAVTYLILWRVVRRFGTRGLVVCVLISAIIGAPRDYLIVARFPNCMALGPGFAPVLADSIRLCATDPHRTRGDADGRRARAIGQSFSAVDSYHVTALVLEILA